MAKESGNWANTAASNNEVSICHVENVRFDRTFVNVENVHGLCQSMSMTNNSSIGPRLRDIYERSELSLDEIARGAGYKGRSSVQNYFSGEYEKANLSNRTAVKLAAAFDGSKVDPEEILALSDAEAVAKAVPRSKEHKLKVIGEVKAGAWLEESAWSEDEQYEIVVGPNPVPTIGRFAVRMVGNSMDKLIPPGSHLECLEVKYGGIIPKDGDLVIVERHNHDLTEMTCKKLISNDGRWLLKCESYQQEFQYSLDVGDADKDLHIDNEVSIIGVVIEARQHHLARV